MYLDAKGLIVQQNGDGGDTLQREGFWYEGIYLVPRMPVIMTPNLAPYNNAITILWTVNGFERSWQVPYNDPSDCSRDQLVSNIRAMGYFDYKGPLDYILTGVIKNFSRFPNGDICFINDYGRFIRAFKSWYLYPLLLIFDLPIIVNSIIRCIAGKDSNNVGDDVNHIGDLAQAKCIFPTPISFLARKIYIAFRPNYNPACRNGAEYALSWYFRADSGGNPEFIKLWAPIVDEF
jgi:hypothetical protein